MSQYHLIILIMLNDLREVFEDKSIEPGVF